MIVFVEGTRYEIKEPRKITLDKYGLSLNEWKEIVCQQNYKCPICLNVLCKTTNIDHYHAKQWGKMSAEKRKLFIRGVTCWWCNKSMLPKGITIEKARRTLNYLERFEKRRPK